MLDWAGESQYYVEPKRLARLGYLDARKEPGKTRERTVYTLNDKGLRALKDYARTPVRFTPVKSDALLRLLLADLVGEEVTRESMGTLREDLDDIRARLEDGRETAQALPHRSKYLSDDDRLPATAWSTCTRSSSSASSASSRRPKRSDHVREAADRLRSARVGEPDDRGLHAGLGEPRSRPTCSSAVAAP